MPGIEHVVEGFLDGAFRVGKKPYKSGNALVFFSIEDMQNGTDKDGMRSFVPVIPSFKRTLGINKNIRDILCVPDLVESLANLKQGIEPDRSRCCRFKPQTVRKTPPPAGCRGPVFFLDIVHHTGTGPGQQCRDNQSNTFARTRRGKAEDMFRAVVAQYLLTFPVHDPLNIDITGYIRLHDRMKLSIVALCQNNPFIFKQSNPLQLSSAGPPCRAIDTRC